MDIAKDGSAIIGGHVVRKHGVVVLRGLATFQKPIAVPHLSERFGEEYSDVHLYTTLNRLCKLNPSLCIRAEVKVKVREVELRRVTYEATEVTKNFFRTPKTDT